MEEDLYVVACTSEASWAAAGSLHCSERLIGSPSTSWHQRHQSKRAKRSSRAEPPAADRLNSAQRASVLASADRTIFRDDRCFLFLFEAEERFSPTVYFGLVQKEVEPRMREVTCEWMLDVRRSASVFSLSFDRTLLIIMPPCGELLALFRWCNAAGLVERIYTVIRCLQKRLGILSRRFRLAK